jgi:predicted DNA-binding transcriptional regulator AlpA
MLPSGVFRERQRRKEVNRERHTPAEEEVMAGDTRHEDALSPDDLRREYGWSRSSQVRAEEKGEFPPCYRVGARRYWRRSVIERWISEQEAKAVAPRGGASRD